MAELEYYVKQTKRGPIVTDSVLLYNSNDGDVFRMPHGADPLNYVARGYMLKPDFAWHEKNKELKAAKSQSLKVSNFQRDRKNRMIEITRLKEVAQVNAEMEQAEADMAAEEAALASPKVPDVAVSVAPDYENMTKAEMIAANPGAGLDMTMTKDTMIAEVQTDDKPPFED